MSHINKDLKDKIKIFDAPTTTESAQIDNVAPVGSYSWLEEKEATLAIPGSPGIWNRSPQRVKPDSGCTLIDQNSYRMGQGRSPLIPLFAAVVELQETPYDFSQLDLITDRNNLRKLFKWIENPGEAESFRIDLELVLNTVLFTRCDSKDSEIIQGFRGFGHSYERAATTFPPGLKNPTTRGYHRINYQTLGKLKMLLRFEVDACIRMTDASAHDSLIAAMSALSVKSPYDRDTARYGVTIRRTTPCTLTPQSHLIKLKTRASRKQVDWHDIFPQLYLSQTPYLYLAKHTAGVFAPTEIYKISDPLLQDRQAETEKCVGKLEVLLAEIIEVVRSEGAHAWLSLVAHQGRLELHRRRTGTGRPSVGKDIKALFVSRVMQGAAVCEMPPKIRK